MSTAPDLKLIERQAYRSTYQDGLWDIYMGLIVMGMSLFVYHPAAGYSMMNWIAFTVTFLLANGVYWLGKRFITLPRLGQVRFGAMRKRRGMVLAIVLGGVIFVQILLVGLSIWGLRNPAVAENLLGTDADLELLLVATLGSLFVGPPMILIAYFNDFPRGYYIAVMMALAVFLMILTNQPVYALVIGAMILIPGVVLLVRFIKQYPLHPQAASHA